MTDVRLTATNPEDSSVVPVACNEKGELKLEEPTVSSDDYVAKAGDTMTGNLHLGDNITLDAIDGSAEFGGGDINLNANGSATFAGNVGIGTDNPTMDLQISDPVNPVVSVVNPTTGAQGVLNAPSGGAINFGSATDHNVLFSTNALQKACLTTAGNFYIGGDVQNDPNISLNADGSAEFGDVSINGGFNQDNGSSLGSGFCYIRADSESPITVFGVMKGGSRPVDYTIQFLNDGSTEFAGGSIGFNANGSAAFASDVIVGSRGKQWMIVESNGLAHLVEQTRSEISTADLVDVEPSISYPPLRDIPGELTMVEEQLQKVLEKLRMVPEAGWEVWDGSDEN